MRAGAGPLPWADRAATAQRFPRLDSSFSPVRWPDWFARNAFSAPAAASGPAFDRGSLVIAAAVQGLGVALESLRFAQDELRAGQLVRLGDGRLESLYRDLHSSATANATGT